LGKLALWILYTSPASQRYDTKGKRLLKMQSRLYGADTGLRNSILARPSGKDLGHLLENVIFLELKKRGGQVYIGKAGNKQVDFVHTDNLLSGILFRQKPRDA
jgi:predicted AAA+ superfamily ATPase